jgi:thymidylate synthase
MSLNEVDQIQHDLYNKILEQGYLKGDRTGVGTIMLPGLTANYDISERRVPMPSTKEVVHRSWRHENLLFISGSSSLKYLKDNKVGIWDSWFMPGTAVYDTDADRVSIQTRLSRIARNNEEAWGAINKIVFTGLHDTRTDDTFTKVTIYRTGRFVDSSVNEAKVAAIRKVCDLYDIPAYPLVDADIGAGSYGVQWRRWQDTQIVPQEEIGTYEAQGYEAQGQLTPDSVWGRGNARGVTSYHVMYREIDQLQNAINMLRTNPDDRRIIVNAWNPGRTWQCALPPCHYSFQFISYPKKAEQILDDLEEKGVLNYLRLSCKEDWGNDALTPGAFEKLYETNASFFTYVKDFCETAAVGINTRLISTLVVMR